MKGEIFSNSRRRALSQTFLNTFTLLVPMVISTEFFLKFELVPRLLLGFFVAIVLGLGWPLMPPDECREKGRS